MAKEKLCNMGVEIRSVSDRMTVIVLCYEEDMMGLICGYAV